MEIFEDIAAWYRSLGDWYAAETFWTAAGVAAAIFIGFATIWVTHRTRFPKRRLTYCLQAVGPTTECGSHPYATNPHKAILSITSRGRLDISPDAYGQNEPVRFDFGLPVLEVLRSSSSGYTKAPRSAASGSTLEVGPGLIKRRATIVYTVLVDGRTTGVTCDSPLIDIEIRHELPEDSDTLTWWDRLSPGKKVAACVGAVIIGFTLKQLGIFS